MGVHLLARILEHLLGRERIRQSFLFDIPIFCNECEFLKPKCPLGESGARLGGC